MFLLVFKLAVVFCLSVSVSTKVKMTTPGARRKSTRKKKTDEERNEEQAEDVDEKQAESHQEQKAEKESEEKDTIISAKQQAREHTQRIREKHRAPSSASKKKRLSLKDMMAGNVDMKEASNRCCSFYCCCKFY